MDKIMEEEANEDYIKKVSEISDKHLKKYGNKKMSLQDLDNIYKE